MTAFSPNERNMGGWVTGPMSDFRQEQYPGITGIGRSVVGFGPSMISPTSTIKGTIGGGLTGAAIGSIIPGIGTGVGAALGAVLGGTISMFKDLTVGGKKLLEGFGELSDKIKPIIQQFADYSTSFSRMQDEQERQAIAIRKAWAEVLEPAVQRQHEMSLDFDRRTERMSIQRFASREPYREMFQDLMATLQDIWLSIKEFFHRVLVWLENIPLIIVGAVKDIALGNWASWEKTNAAIDRVYDVLAKDIAVDQDHILGIPTFRTNTALTFPWGSIVGEPLPVNPRAILPGGQAPNTPGQFPGMSDTETPEDAPPVPTGDGDTVTSSAPPPVNPSRSKRREGGLASEMGPIEITIDYANIDGLRDQLSMVEKDLRRLIRDAEADSILDRLRYEHRAVFG